jgi:hypothetical protein
MARTGTPKIITRPVPPTAEELGVPACGYVLHPDYPGCVLPAGHVERGEPNHRSGSKLLGTVTLRRPEDA